MSLYVISKFKNLSSHCPINKVTNTAKKLTLNSQEIDYLLSQETNSNIEPGYLEPLHKNNSYSQTSTSGGQTPALEGEIIGVDRLKTNDGKSLCLGTGGRHIWRSYEKERTDKDGNKVIYYYVHCLSCGDRYHKKGEPPMVYEELPEPIVYI